MNMLQNIRDAVECYIDIGFDPIPVKQNSKIPCFGGWDVSTPSELWCNAPIGVNVGLRGGGVVNAAYFDCDEPGTFNRLQEWLLGLNWLPGDYPVIRSASGSGRHVYVTLIGGLEGQWSNLSTDFGSGEFRYGSGAYVVAPPSRINGQTYSLLDGDLKLLPVIEANDVIPILARKILTTNYVSQEISRRTIAYLKGKCIDRYRSRSEFEQAIIVSLINAGYSYE